MFARLFEAADRASVVDERRQVIALGKDCRCSARESLLLGVCIAACGEQENRQFRRYCSQLLSRLQSIHLRHGEVQDGQVGRYLLRLGNGYFRPQHKRQIHCPIRKAYESRLGMRYRCQRSAPQACFAPIWKIRCGERRRAQFFRSTCTPASLPAGAVVHVYLRL
jgi:hypothetical protein